MTANPSPEQLALLEDAQLAVVIPAYRVKAHIADVITGVPAFVRFIVVVDDACPDGSGDLVEGLEDPRVTLVRHEKNRGVGGAMLTGYAVALELGAGVLAKMDGDDQMDPAELWRLVLPIVEGQADYAKGNRFKQLRTLGRMPFLRRLGNFGLTFMTKMASGYWDIFDPTNGYTAIHRRTLQLLDPERISHDYFFESQMLLELQRVRAVVCDVPMPARYGSEESSLRVGRVLLTFPWRLGGGFIRRLSRQYFLHDFSPTSLLLLMGIPLLIFGVVWGAYHWVQSIQTGTTSTTGTVLLAVLPIILAVQFLLQAVSMDMASVPRQALHSGLPLTEIDESERWQQLYEQFAGADRISPVVRTKDSS